MCSIFGMFDLAPGDDFAALRLRALECSRRQRHRGPDWSGVFVDAGAILMHERLAIVDPASGAQPLRSRDGQLALAVNGEIYNHRELRAATSLAVADGRGEKSTAQGSGLDGSPVHRGAMGQESASLETAQAALQPAPISDSKARGYDFTTGSDCEVINALYRSGDAADFIEHGVGKLNGIFAFALWDGAAKRYLIARDPLGVCPLYWGHDAQGRLCVASEMKALVGLCADVAEFPAGHIYDSASGELHQYYRKPWRDYAATKGHALAEGELRHAFEQAVHRQLMTDVPYGVLLSGGLDSSLVAACAAKFARERIEDGDQSEAWWPRLHSFAIGLEG